MFFAKTSKLGFIETVSFNKRAHFFATNIVGHHDISGSAFVKFGSLVGGIGGAYIDRRWVYLFKVPGQKEACLVITDC